MEGGGSSPGSFYVVEDEFVTLFWIFTFLYYYHGQKISSYKFS